MRTFYSASVLVLIHKICSFRAQLFHHSLRSKLKNAWDRMVNYRNPTRISFLLPAEYATLVSVVFARCSTSPSFCCQIKICAQAGVDTVSPHFIYSLNVLLSTSQSVSALMSFFLAMTLYPEVQKRAQDEIDSIVGVDRLPENSDQAQLPYCSAMCKELLRYVVKLHLSLALS